MKWLKILVPSIIISMLSVSCSTGSVYTNDNVYRSPDGGYYKRGEVYRDRNGNSYRNGQIVIYKDTRGLPPGQAKKIYGDKSAKKYAPGQRKKNNYYNNNDQGENRNGNYKNKRKNKHHHRGND